MQRRRFFPARPVQQMPGRRVELAVQVRKEGAAPVPPQAPVAGGAVSWVAPSPLISEWVGTTMTAIDGEPVRWRVSLGDVSSSMVDLVFEGEVLPWPTVEFPEVPESLGYRYDPWWYGEQLPLTIPSGAWRCTQISYLASVHNEFGHPYYAGAYFGLGAERVQWVLAWSSPGAVPGSSSDGSMAVPYGAAIYVYPVRHSLLSSIAPSTLVATAMLDGAPVGTLEFELRGLREG